MEIPSAGHSLAIARKNEPPGHFPKGIKGRETPVLNHSSGSGSFSIDRSVIGRCSVGGGCFASADDVLPLTDVLLWQVFRLRRMLLSSNSVWPLPSLARNILQPGKA